MWTCCAFCEHKSTTCGSALGSCPYICALKISLAHSRILRIVLIENKCARERETLGRETEPRFWGGSDGADRRDGISAISSPDVPQFPNSVKLFLRQVIVN